MRVILATILGLAASQIVHAQARPDSLTNPFAANPAAAAVDGKRLFDATCVTCHGPDAAGTERGPSLDSGRFKHGGEDYEVFQTIQKGVPGTAMPPFGALRAEELWQLVSYVKSLSRTASTAASEAMTGDAARGEQLFFGDGQCSSCHEINGRGSLLAADLSASGRRPVAAIQAAIEHPTRRAAFGASQRWVEVTLRDGTQLKGLAKSEDSFSVVLQTMAGDFRLLDRRQIRTIANSASIAPAALAERLTPDQKADLVAYLSQQRQRAALISIESGGDRDVSFARLTRAGQEPHNWLTYWGSYRSEHFSELKQIDRRNVSRLQARWAVPMPGSSYLEATPLVVDGVMYVSGPPGDVYALDARSGLQLWRFHRQQERVNPFQINPFNRGVAVLGRRVFVATLDNDLIALDARSGRVLWQRQAIADTMQGYTMTGAPLALENKIIVGISGGEMGVRGFLAAYDVSDGHELWRFETIPGPGQPGHDTWSGDSWKTGSGATWLTGSYDAELRLIYWAVGNPGPDYDPENRKGDNLYTDSVLALDPDTGRLVWHYQFTPNDTHDWDATEAMVLAEVPIEGRSRKVLLHADRNGFFYTLDRATGQFISAKPFVRQTWNKGFEANGRPIVDPASIATRAGHPIMPSIGGTNFQAPSYDPAGRVLYLAFMDAEGGAAYQPAQYRAGQAFTGANFGTRRGPPSHEPEQGVLALDAVNGRTLWKFPVTRASIQAGVLATRGELVFAATAEGNLIALDSHTGESLWHFQTGAVISAAPMSYSVDGTQFVALAAGNTLYSFALPEQRAGTTKISSSGGGDGAPNVADVADKDKLLIEAIDVEGGAATLYITPEHQSLLIDTGWPAGIGAKDPDSAQRIIAAARRHGLSKLDYVLITHYHVDHVGGVTDLLRQFPVGTVLDHGPNRETPPPNANPAFASFQPATLYPKYLEAIRGHKHRELKVGDTLNIGSLRMTVVTSDGATLKRPLSGAGGTIAECEAMQPMAENGGEENARSVGVVLTFGRSRIAALGDLIWNVEQDLVCPRDKVGPVDLLFVSHHGAHFSNSPALLHALAPRIAIVANGAKKGGDAESYDTVMRSPRLERLWQLHFAERAGAEHNTPERYIANPDSTNDSHASLEVTVTKQGAVTVTNGRTGSMETYAPVAGASGAGKGGGP